MYSVAQQSQIVTFSTQSTLSIGGPRFHVTADLHLNFECHAALHELCLISQVIEDYNYMLNSLAAETKTEIESAFSCAINRDAVSSRMQLIYKLRS